jgi:shikimate dehydrogenase
MARQRLAVLGHPIAHSRSPAMQNAALRKLGLAPEWSYEAIDVTPERFEERVRAMAGEGFVGANVTLPHKLVALALADEASAAAREIGAANTLSFGGGRIIADNTDAEGLLAALAESPAGKRALVLGAGGAARAAVWGLLRADADVAIWNRTSRKAAMLAQELGASASQQVDATAFDLVVNATTVGLDLEASLGSLPVDAQAIHERQTVVDLAYGEGTTELARLARQRGARVVDGLEVLVHQGAGSLRIWTGAEPPLDAMRKAAHEDGSGDRHLLNERT